MHRRLVLVGLVALSGSVVTPVMATTAAAADLTPTVTVGDLNVPEGDAGNVVARIPFHLDRPAPTKVSVRWRMTGAGATPGTDYAAPVSGVRSGTVGIAAGALDGAVAITIKGDTDTEPDDAARVDILGVTGAAVGRDHGTITIRNDDSGIPDPSIRAATGTPLSFEGDAGSRHALVPVVLSRPATGPLTVRVAVLGSEGTPLTGDSCHDLNASTVKPSTTTLKFSAGQQSKQIRIPVRGNASVNQPVTAVDVTTSLVTGAANVETPTDTVYVVDDDAANAGGTAPPVGTQRVSETADGGNPTFPPSVANTASGCGYPSSTSAAISGDGRFVAFSSNADNLVGNDTNGYGDAFVKDTWTGDIALVSNAPDGAPANNESHVESISRDGRFVTYSSRATNLTAGDDNAWSDSFLYDRQTGTTVRLGDSHVGNHGSSSASLSADGRMVVFASTAPIAGQCTACTSGVYVWDRTTGTTTLVSNGAANANSYFPAISGDGAHVAFLAPDILGRAQVYERDLPTNALTAVSVNDAGVAGSGTFGTMPDRPALSDNGQVVAFRGDYCNFGLASYQCGTADNTHVYGVQTWVRDRIAGTTRVASIGPDGSPTSFVEEPPSISADGRYVTFDSNDTAAAPECAADGGQHVFQRDRATATTVRVDVTTGTPPCMETAFTMSNAAMSADGSILVYTAMAGPTDVSASNPEAVYRTRLR